MIMQEFITEKTKKLALKKGLTIQEVAPNFWNPAKNDEPCWYQASLQKWLREKYSINIVVQQYQDSPDDTPIFQGEYYSFLIEEELDDNQYFDTYEEALEDALTAALKLIK